MVTESGRAASQPSASLGGFIGSAAECERRKCAAEGWDAARRRA